MEIKPKFFIENCNVISPNLDYRSCEVLHYQLYGNFSNYERDQSSILKCMNNPYKVECLPTHGYPMIKEMVATGFQENDTKFNTFKITVVNVPMFQNYPMFSFRTEWEYELEEYLESEKQNLAKDNVFLTYLTHHNNFYDTSPINISLHTLCFFIVACCVAHIIYLSFVLRLTRRPRVILAVSIVVINVLSIFSASGLLTFCGYKSSGQMVTIMPLLLMSTGADNMVILVFFCQHDKQNIPESKTFGTHIGRNLCLIGPSLRANVLSAIVCSALAAVTADEYAEAIGVHLSVALTINWLLQETCFIAILAVDLRRTAGQRNRAASKSSLPTTNSHDSCWDAFVRNRFTPLLHKKRFQAGITVACISTLCCNLNLIGVLKTGEDMTQYWMHNSSVREYLEFDHDVDQLGPPVFFVVTGGLDFSIPLNRILIDTEYESSIPNQITRAGKFSPNNYIHSIKVDSWWNDFQDWLKTPGCCQRNARNSKPCQPGEPNYNKSECLFCEIPIGSHKRYPTKQFYYYLSQFIMNKPWNGCQFGGIGRYYGNLNNKNKNGVDYVIKGFHTVLRTPEDHIRAVRSARQLCANMTRMAQTYLKKVGMISLEEIAKFTIFPYSQFYLFYDQYVEIWSTTIPLFFAVSLTAVFVVHLLGAGLNWVLSLLVVCSVTLITVNIVGCLYMSNVPVNAVSISFMIICIGIAPRFVVIFLDTYGQSLHTSRANRHTNAVHIVAKPLIWGVIGNKLIWLVPLWYADQLYFKVYSFFIISGVLTGILYIPTFIYFISKRYLFSYIFNIRLTVNII